MKNLSTCLRVILISLPLITPALADDFYAYYTKIPGNFENVLAYDDELFGKFADIIVKIDNSRQVIFSRKKSYLPYLKTTKAQYHFPEIIPRTGDGDENNPDRINRYSHVRIIEQSHQKIVIHWRYMPDFSNVDWDGVVDEYFYFTPTGNVTRTIRKGTEKLDTWNSLISTLVQKIELNQNGIEHTEPQKAGPDKKPAVTVTASPVKKNILQNPILEFTFNEGDKTAGNETRENTSGKTCQIKGHKTLWKKGVSCTALQFDGYYSGINAPKIPHSKIKNSFTIEAWLALGAYPFGWAPIAQQAKWSKAGFYLGVNEHGYPGLHITAGNKWNSIIHKSPLDLFQWYQLAAAFDKKTGKITLFVNGKEVQSESIPRKELEPADVPLMLGLNSQKMPPVEGRVRRGKWPSLFGIDGLIDEIRIYDKSLSEKQISKSFKNLKTSDSTIEKPDMQPRHLPKNPKNKTANEFGAEYTKIQYYETWDNMWRVSEHPDVLVDFDLLPTHILFWRGTSYGPFLITENGKWVGDQSSENYRQIEQPGLAEGCCEHMSDKQCRHSHVRIIENTDARVLIHWRYGLVDSRYNFVPTNNGWGDWADEYWTIYPDGIAIRHLARGKIWGDSWVETMFLSEPGTKPEDNVQLDAFSVVNPEGETETLNWKNGYKENDVFEALITMVHPKSQYNTFNIYPTDSSVRVFGGGGGRSDFHWWNHWPAAQITSDGRGATAPDRLAHSSLVWGIPSEDFLLYGFTKKEPTALMDLAKSWNNPPDIRRTDGCSTEGYKQNQRAYILNADSDTLSFTLNCSEEHPAVNPCFVVENWKNQKAEITVNGKNIKEGKNFRQGTTYNNKGKKNLVTWLRTQSQKPLEININPQN